MKKEERKLLIKLKKILDKRVNLHQLILFGSRARGDADPDSDMDLLVILNEPVTPETRDIVSRCAWVTGFQAGIVIAPVVVFRDDWENGPERLSLLAMAVREEGQLV